MKKIGLPFTILLSLFISSCISSIPANQSYGKNGRIRAENYTSGWKKIPYFFEGQKHSIKRYSEVAWLQIRGGQSTTYPAMFKKLKKEASRFRAHAIIDVEIKTIAVDQANLLLGTALVIDAFSGTDDEYCPDDEEELEVVSSFNTYLITGRAIISVE